MTEQKTEQKIEEKKTVRDYFVDLNRLIEEYKAMGTALCYVIRGSQGLQPQEDAFQGLLNVADKRERTRVNIHQAYAHVIMNLLATYYPKEMGFWKDHTEQEDTYFIALEGEQRREAIAMKATTQQVNVQPVAVPQPAQEAKKDEKKKGWFRR